MMEGSNANISFSLDTDKEKLPFYLCNTDQLENFYNRFLYKSIGEVKGLSNEFHDIWYSKAYRLNEVTAEGQFIDMLSVFYPVTAAWIFADTLWYSEPENEIAKDITKDNAEMKVRIIQNLNYKFDTYKLSDNIHGLESGPGALQVAEANYKMSMYNVGSAIVQDFNVHPANWSVTYTEDGPSFQYIGP